MRIDLTLKTSDGGNRLVAYGVTRIDVLKGEQFVLSIVDGQPMEWFENNDPVLTSQDIGPLQAKTYTATKEGTCLVQLQQFNEGGTQIIRTIEVEVFSVEAFGFKAVQQERIEK